MNIVFFGDSICFGQGISLHKGWVVKISKALEELSTGLGRKLTVINTSINGNTTRIALERMPYDVQSHGVDIIIIQFGMNDCNYWKSDNGVPRVSINAFKANLIEIVDRAMLFGARKVFINTNHPTQKTELFEYADISYQQSNALYNEAIREVVPMRSIIQLNDIEKEFHKKIKNEKFKLEDLLLEDGTHLSTLGHELYTNILCPSILNGVKEVCNA